MVSRRIDLEGCSGWCACANDLVIINVGSSLSQCISNTCEPNERRNFVQNTQTKYTHTLTYSLILAHKQTPELELVVIIIVSSNSIIIQQSVDLLISSPKQSTSPTNRNLQPARNDINSSRFVCAQPQTLPERQQQQTCVCAHALLCLAYASN